MGEALAVICGEISTQTGREILGNKYESIYPLALKKYQNGFIAIFENGKWQEKFHPSGWKRRVR